MKIMKSRAIWIIATSVVCLALGVALSRRVEPGVRVEAMILADHTPALRFFPADSGPHPIALLAHGVTASKETLFRLGEALAAAGFTCFAIDLPGHGESTLSFADDENAGTLESVASTLGVVDIFVGHSMGAYAGAESVRNGRLNPRLFVAMGALPDLGQHGPPLLLLAGRFEEAVSPARLRARADARLVVSPWSDHALEPYDPFLVQATVEAACATVGKVPPTAPGRWRWRLAGAVVAGLGALALGNRLPDLFPRLTRARGPLVSILAIVSIAFTTGTWVGAVPIPRRMPLQLVAVVFLALAIFGARKLGLPRWSFSALSAAVALICVMVGAYFPALLACLSALVLVAGTIVGRIAARNGTQSDGDVALAMFVGYAFGQWIPIIF